MPPRLPLDGGGTPGRDVWLEKGQGDWGLPDYYKFGGPIWGGKSKMKFVTRGHGITDYTLKKKDH